MKKKKITQVFERDIIPIANNYITKKKKRFYLKNLIEF